METADPAANSKHKYGERVRALVIDDDIQDVERIIKAAARHLPGVEFITQPKEEGFNPQTNEPYIVYPKPPEAVDSEDYGTLVTLINEKKPHLIFVDISTNGSGIDTNGAIAIKAIMEASDVAAGASRSPTIVCCSYHLDASNPSDALVRYLDEIGGQVPQYFLPKSKLEIGNSVSTWENIWYGLQDVYSSILHLRDGKKIIRAGDFICATVNGDKVEIRYEHECESEHLDEIGGDHRTLQTASACFRGFPTFLVKNISDGKQYLVNLLYVDKIVSNPFGTYSIHCGREGNACDIQMTHPSYLETIAEIRRLVADWNLNELDFVRYKPVGKVVKKAPTG